MDKITIINNLKGVVNALEQVTIKGTDNMRYMYGSIDYLRKIVEELSKSDETEKE